MKWEEIGDLLRKVSESRTCERSWLLYKNESKKPVDKLQYLQRLSSGTDSEYWCWYEKARRIEKLERICGK